jgi:hypothetical protein
MHINFYMYLKLRNEEVAQGDCDKLAKSSHKLLKTMKNYLTHKGQKYKMYS